jgi:hypothetical protein
VSAAAVLDHPPRSPALRVTSSRVSERSTRSISRATGRPAVALGGEPRAPAKRVECGAPKAVAQSASNDLDRWSEPDRRSRRAGIRLPSHPTPGVDGLRRFPFCAATVIRKQWSDHNGGGCSVGPDRSWPTESVEAPCELASPTASLMLLHACRHERRRPSRGSTGRETPAADPHVLEVPAEPTDRKHPEESVPPQDHPPVTWPPHHFNATEAHVHGPNLEWLARGRNQATVE